MKARASKRIFERKYEAGEYVHQMMAHLEEVEEGLRARAEMDEYGCGLTSIWILEHKDGRIARIDPPKKGTSEYWHQLSERRQKAWINYLKRKYNVHED